MSIPDNPTSRNSRGSAHSKKIEELGKPIEVCRTEKGHLLLVTTKKLDGKPAVDMRWFFLGQDGKSHPSKQKGLCIMGGRRLSALRQALALAEQRLLEAGSDE